MLGLYYRVWVDCMKRIKAQPENRESWISKSMVSMSIAMVFNFAFIMAILQRNVLGVYFYHLELDFPNRYWGNVWSFIILFVLPVIAINFLLILRNQRYRKLMVKYPYKNGILFMTYFSISVMLPVIALIVGYIFFRD